MTKILFIIFITIHGFIHLIGFLKAFSIMEIEQLSMSISRPAGVIWLVAALLFIVSALFYIFDMDIWPFVAVSVILVSQVLIITAWQNAKYGTLANILILLIAIPAFGQYQFNHMVEKEQENLISHISPVVDQSITNEDISHLPPVVQNWLHTSGALNKPEITSVRLKQTGQMKTKPDGKWMDFTAHQIFDVKHPAFLWTTRMKMMPLIHLAGRDKLENGNGEMLIKILSLIKVVDEGPNEKINSGALLRFLAEIVWFPTAACNDYLQWQEIDPLSARGTLTTAGDSVNGTFRFHENGDFHSFEADRYYGGNPDATQRRWLIEATAYKDYHGYRIPCKAKVTWKLPEGDFMWLQLEVTEVEYN